MLAPRGRRNEAVTLDAGDLERLPYTRRVITEALRLYPPAYLLGRQAVADVVLEGYRIPAGTTLLMSQYLMHRDARFFPDPEMFLPDRWAAPDPDSATPRLPALRLLSVRRRATRLHRRAAGLAGSDADPGRHQLPLAPAPPPERAGTGSRAAYHPAPARRPAPGTRAPLTARCERTPSAPPRPGVSRSPGQSSLVVEHITVVYGAGTRIEALCTALANGKQLLRADFHAAQPFLAGELA